MGELKMNEPAVKNATPEISIIIVDPNEDSAKSLAKMLDCDWPQHINISIHPRITEHLAEENDQYTNLVILNYETSETDIAKTIKDLSKKTKTACIVVNGPNDKITARACLQDGAQDYLSKIELGSNSLNKAVLHACLRTQYQKIYEQNFQREEQNLKTGLSKIIVDPIHDSDNPVEKMKKIVSELREVVAKKEQIKIKDAVTILQTAEDISQDFRSIISELKVFWKQVSENPKVRFRERSSYHLLIVDDEPELIEIITRLLNKMGFEHIDSARDGLEAYRKCISTISQRHRYDIIITDWKMPKSTGIEFLERIRNNEFFKQTPVMIISAIDERLKIEQALDLKVSEYIVKPFSSENFQRKIEALLRTQLE